MGIIGRVEPLRSIQPLTPTTEVDYNGSKCTNTESRLRQTTTDQPSLWLNGAYLRLIHRDAEDPFLDLTFEEQKAPFGNIRKTHTGRWHMGGLDFKMNQEEMDPTKKIMEVGPLDRDMVRTAHAHGRTATLAFTPNLGLVIYFYFF